MGYNIEDYLPFTVNDDNFFSDPNRMRMATAYPFPKDGRVFMICIGSIFKPKN